MKIGFIGSGNIGGAIGELLAKAGHEVFLLLAQSGQPEAARARVGPRARAGTPKEAIAFGDVCLPRRAVFLDGADRPGLRRGAEGKIVLDAGNPNVRRDGRSRRRPWTRARHCHRRASCRARASSARSIS
jgi:predicted dinucleotide-binding enzyme